MEISNLLSGFIGALAAVVLQKVYEYAEKYKTLADERKALRTYLQQTILTALEEYKVEITAIEKQMKDYRAGNIPTQNYGLYLSLTSEMLRATSYSEIFKKLDNDEAYTSYIDLGYALDYLKKELPFEHFKRYFNEFSSSSEMRKTTLFAQVKHTLDMCDSAIESTNKIILVLANH